MSQYFILRSVNSLYFTESNLLYPMEGSKPIFSMQKHLQDVDKGWLLCLSKEDKKKIEKDLKKFNKI